MHIDLAFDVLYYAFGSMLLGVFITIIGVGLLFYLVKSFYPKYTFTPITYIVGAILFILLAYHSILICGAFKIKGMTDDIGVSVTEYISVYNIDHYFTEEETQDIINSLRDDYPLFACYVGSGDFSNHTPSTIVQAMIDECHEFMNIFILKHLGWCVAFIAIGTFIVIKTMDAYHKTTRRSSSTARRRSRRDDF
ncbi:MAG: hypothetical protein IJN66_09725 [Muribaculaceae bacterium]|nr:hypothetical protein [Muribaculaceae bacterium]MBQ7042967.1 hypothetical protein [Muribaculaceae bacterium]